MLRSIPGPHGAAGLQRHGVAVDRGHRRRPVNPLTCTGVLDCCVGAPSPSWPLLLDPHAHTVRSGFGIVDRPRSEGSERQGGLWPIGLLRELNDHWRHDQGSQSAPAGVGAEHHRLALFEEVFLIKRLAPWSAATTDRAVRMRYALGHPMNEPWPVSFDFYETWRGEDRAFIMLDLAARAHAPVPTHPIRLQYRAQMQSRREDGLRSADEAPALFALEDQLVEAACAKFQAIYVGRVVSQGFTEFVFYAPGAQRDQLKSAGGATGQTGPYDLEWLMEDDPDWSGYDDLYPNRYGLQTILNRRLVAQMVESGDQLEMPREVDHAAYFSSRVQADEASRALATAGFRIDPLPEPEPGDSWFLQFHRQERCDGEEPDHFVFEILELLEPHEGDYDGWGSLVQRAPQ